MKKQPKDQKSKEKTQTNDSRIGLEEISCVACVDDKWKKRFSSIDLHRKAIHVALRFIHVQQPSMAWEELFFTTCSRYPRPKTLGEAVLSTLVCFVHLGLDEGLYRDWIRKLGLFQPRKHLEDVWRTSPSVPRIFTSNWKGFHLVRIWKPKMATPSVDLCFWCGRPTNIFFFLISNPAVDRNTSSGRPEMSRST